MTARPVPLHHVPSRFPRRAPWRVTAMAALALGAASPALAQTDATPVQQLKKLSLEELTDLEVTSVSKWPQKLQEAASAIQVITGDDIQRSGASELVEALRLAGNLDIAQANAHDWKVSARGFNTDLSNKLLVLVDGRTVYTPLYSGVFWDAQDYLLEDVDRIEVISGPGGTLWGANAVNGVINVITKSAKDTQGSYLDAGGGNELQSFSAARYGGTLAPGVYFRVYGKYFDRDSTVLTNGADGNDSWHESRGGFRLDAETIPDTTLTLQGDIYDADENVPTGGHGDISGGNILGRWVRSTSDDAGMSLQVYFDRTHLSSPKPAVAQVGAGTLEDDLDTYDLDFEHHFRGNDRHRLVWGLGYRLTHDVAQNAPSVGFIPEQVDHSLYSAFLQDEIQLHEDLFFTLGTKLEHNHYTGFEWEPSARLRWNFTPTQMFWAAVSRAVRTPSRVDRDLIEPTGFPAPFPQNILIGSADFDSETEIAYELGYRWQFPVGVTGSLSVFYNDYDHLRSITPGPPGIPSLGFPLVLHNNLEGESHGAELSVTWPVLDWWRMQGAYDLLEEHLHVKPGQVDFTNAQNETADPENQVSLRSSMDLPGAISFDTTLRWVGALPTNNGATPGTVPAYCELDVRLGWHPTPQLELSLVGQNLLHDHHQEYGFPSATTAQIERSIYGRAVLRW
ncbi:MAG TPA: TonB-dependent receptor [Opitutus sp.]|nr:TonB-dependent receptor [Opitutus sp.]